MNRQTNNSKHKHCCQVINIYGIMSRCLRGSTLRIRKRKTTHNTTLNASLSVQKSKKRKTKSLSHEHWTARYHRKLSSTRTEAKREKQEVISTCRHLTAQRKGRFLNYFYLVPLLVSFFNIRPFCFFNSSLYSVINDIYLSIYSYSCL